MSEIKYITPCCNKDFTDTDSLGPIFLNPYNEKVQCHNCGEVFVQTTQLTEARELIESIFKQHYGLKHTWCGTWMNCDHCKSMYSFGGNWCTKEGECPYCRAKKFLEGEK